MRPFNVASNGKNKAMSIISKYKGLIKIYHPVKGGRDYF
jgi:hypothetical protein